MSKEIGVWFPLVQRHTGVDEFTKRLAESLTNRGIRTQIDLLPSWAEYLPWFARTVKPPSWATHVHINSWLHERFIPPSLVLIVSLHSCVHDENLTKYKSFLQKLYHRFWVKRCELKAIRLADSTIAVSQYTANRAIETFKDRNITSIPNWVDTHAFSSVKIKTNTKPFKLLFVGNLSSRKGADLLPHIMSKLGSEYILYYTGLANFFVGRDTANMIAVGRVFGDDLIDLYSDCHALLFPSRMEGMPLAVLESLSCSRPVIAANCSSLPELIEEGMNGILCKKDNVNDFVSAIKKIASSFEKYQAMSKAARASVLNNFTEEKSVSAYISIYRKTAMANKCIDKD